jgi:hypothetical protein
VDRKRNPVPKDRAHSVRRPLHLNVTDNGDMRKGGRAVRLKLFDKLTEDLSRSILGKRGVVLCPLCLAEFGRDAAESGLLTEEHVIPNSTGSREVTLTCKPCNDRLGYQIDHHLARKIRLDRGFKGGETLKGHLRWSDGGAPADVVVGPSGDVRFHLKPTTPEMESLMVERASQYARGERQLRLRVINGLSLSKYLASVAKAAYLGLFVDRGYAYILLPSLGPIRRAINDDGPERKRLSEIIVPCEITDFTDLPDAPDRVTFETHSLGGIPVCLSMINLRNLSGAAWAVLPPGTNVNTGAWDGLARAADALQGKSNVQIEVKPGGEVIVSGL